MSALLPLSAAAVPSSAETAILATLRKQQEAWNTGDLASFMESYEDSPETLYVGAKLVRGYEAIRVRRERYERRYSGSSAMGRLTFHEIEVRLVDEHIAVGVGRFALERDPAEGGAASGLFTVVMRKAESAWKIIHDHTS